MAADETGRCPYLRRLEGRNLHSVEGYCRAYRNGRLRIPSIEEFQDLCTTGRYVTCQTYRIRVEQEAEAKGHAA